LVMFQVILLTLMGANNGGREISAERILYEKERMTGLRPWAYAFSKIVFVSLVAIFQGVWMCFFVKLICNFPGPWAEQVAILAASCVSMSVVCLGFSAMLTSPEKSSLLSIYLVGFQLPLSGVVLALPAALTWVCRPFINSYWGWSGYMKSMMGQPLYDAYTASMPNQNAYVASTTRRTGRAPDPGAGRFLPRGVRLPAEALELTPRLITLGPGGRVISLIREIAGTNAKEGVGFREGQPRPFSCPRSTPSSSPSASRSS